MGNSKKSEVTTKAKEPVKIRFKLLANGNKSLYLDSSINGKREREFLRLYLIPEHTAADKEANRETVRTAMAVKSQRIVELQNAAHGFSVISGRSKMNVLEYVKKIAEVKLSKAQAEGRDIRSSGYQQYMALYYHIQQFSGNKVTFRNVDKKFCQDFIDYLKVAKNGNDTGIVLSENTQAGYLGAFQYVLNCAISDDITNTNPFKQIKPENKPKHRQTEVGFLTLEEVNKLANVETLPSVKNSFLFSCWSGLRFSDVKGMTWGKLQNIDGVTYLIYVQKKTKKQEYLPIGKNALQYLPARPDGAKDDDFVFKVPSGGYTNMILKTWAMAAGVPKHLTFHMSRHTHATLLLSVETPIETVSKILGHSDIQTTQIYAKVLNKSVLAAINKLNEL